MKLQYLCLECKCLNRRASISSGSEGFSLHNLAFALFFPINVLSCTNAQAKPTKHELPISTPGVDTTCRKRSLFKIAPWMDQMTHSRFLSLCNGLEQMQFDSFQFWNISWDAKSGVVKPVLNTATAEKNKNHVVCTGWKETFLCPVTENPWELFYQLQFDEAEEHYTRHL